MKAEYELFAHKFITTGDKYGAYKAIFPKASGDALQAGARRLINNPDVRQYIRKQFTEVQKDIAEQARADAQRRLDEETASLALIRKALRGIITGEKKVQKFFKYKNHIEIVEAEVSPTAIMRAAEIEMKISNGWYARPQKNGKEASVSNMIPDCDRYSYHPDDLWELMYGPDYVPGIRARMVKHNPGLAEEYRQKGLRVLDHTLTDVEVEKMKEAQEKKMAEWRELKKFADDYIDDDIETMSVESPEEEKAQLPDPPSIPQIYPPQDETEMEEHAKETPAPASKKIIVVKDKLNVTDCNNTDMSAYPEYANDVNANPYIRTGVPKKLVGKVNPLSQPRPMERRQYSQEEQDAIFEKDYQSAIREEGNYLYLPPEEREGASYKKYMQTLGWPKKTSGDEQKE